MATKEELRAKLDELGTDQPAADAKKEELEEAVAKAGGSSNVEENLSPEGQEAFDKLPEGSKEAAAPELDAFGPLKLQAPEDRIMTGAATEEQGKAFDEALKDKPEHFVGDVSEAGFSGASRPAKGSPKDNLSPNDERDPKDVLEVRAEDVIDFPAPLAEREALATGKEVKGDTVAEQSPSGAFHNEPLGSASQPGSRSRLFEQKAVFYTDGLSGDADHNHERAYETPEVLQSNNPAVREAGDESLSEAAREDKSESEQRRAEKVKSGELVDE